MKKGILIVIIATIALFGVFAVSTYNNFVTQEKGIKASHKNLENIYASIFNNIKSQGLVVEKYGDMVIKAIETSMTGRYGDGGSQAAFQWIQEQNPEIDPEVFQKLQTVVDASYNEFKKRQEDKLDRLRVYEISLEIFPKNIVANIFGFPRINMKEYGEVISSEETKEVFEKKEMKAIDPF